MEGRLAHICSSSKDVKEGTRRGQSFLEGQQGLGCWPRSRMPRCWSPRLCACPQTSLEECYYESTYALLDFIPVSVQVGF